ncbi:MAG: class I SAM-dependent methyltransferase [Myxococcaceae bacterium]
MSPATVRVLESPAERAALSCGQSDHALHEWVASLLGPVKTLLDVGCGQGRLASVVSCERYLGCDLVRYPGFPSEQRFVEADLNQTPYPLKIASADAVVSVETIEHLENPRAFLRELTRLAAPGGTVLVTTPNQLSLLSKLSLVLKNQFNAFQEAPGLYPAHITALLEEDLVRIATECGLEEIEIHYSNRGRFPGTARHWPAPLKGRAFSDNLLLRARRSRG